jgi:phospholipid/cholesterol/gamma-HCH transport system substrate-binding protein
MDIQSRSVEILVGAFVAVGIASLFMLAMRVSNLASLSTGPGYPLSAKFQDIGGLKVRAPVTLAGVAVGRVTGIGLDTSTYQAVVSMNIEARYFRLPTDTSASIYTAGLLGENYIALEPGGEETFLKPGGQITLTQSALVLERMIGQFLFSKGSDATDNASPPAR